MLLPLRLRTEDKEAQTEESAFRTFGKAGRSFHQSSRQKAMCLFPPKNAELAIILCESWTRTNKRPANEVEIHGEKGKRSAQYWRLLTILLLEGKLALLTCVLECCMGAIYWWDIGGLLRIFFFAIAYLENWSGISIKGTQDDASHISGRC